MQLSEVAKILPAFDPDRSEGLRVGDWVARIEELMRIYGFGETTLLAAIKLSWGGSAKKWLESRGGGEKTWQEVKALMERDFTVDKTMWEIMEEIQRTERKEGQSLLNYFLDVEWLAMGKVAERDLTRAIIRGSKDQVLMNRWGEGVISRDELWDRMKQRDQEKMMVRGSGQLVKQTGIKERQEQQRAVWGGQRNRGVVISQCHRCGEYGHWARFCKMGREGKGIICYQCKGRGHAQWECRQEEGNGRMNTLRAEDCQSTGRRDSESSYATSYSRGERRIHTDSRSEVNAVVKTGNARGKTAVLNALVDTGSDVSAIRNDKIFKENKIDKWEGKRKIKGINGSRLRVEGQWKTDIGIERKEYKANLLVVPEETMKNDIILGRDFLRENGINGLELGKRKEKKRVRWEDEANGQWDVWHIQLENEEEKRELEVGDDEETRREKGRLERVFRQSYIGREGKEGGGTKYEVGIRLKEDKVVFNKPRRMSMVEKEAVGENVRKLLEEGVIRKSNSEFSSRVVLVKKKDGSLRMCIDYRKLNELVEKEHYPMPVIEDVILGLQGKRFFTSLDLRNGFHHVDLKEGAKKYTAFMTPLGQFEYNKLPFGFANAPAAFIRYMDRVLEKFIEDDRVVSYMDDIVVATKTVEEHLEILSEVLGVLAENRVRLQLKKCNWLRKRIDFLGYKISEEGIMPGDHHVEAVKTYPRPTDVKEVQRFVGLVGYFRRFIKNFKDWAAPLLKVIKSNKFAWGEEQDEAFCGLRDRLIEKPLLRIFSHKAKTELHTDASAGGFGAILLQEGNEGKMYPVSYFSRKTTAAEQKLHSFELETLAVVYSLQRFRAYLFGLKFKLVTDCSAMQMTLAKRDISPKIERWAMWLGEFDFTIEHRKGEKMKHADALSRVNMLVLDELLEEEGLEEEEEAGSGEEWKLRLVVAQLRDGKIGKLKEQVLKGEKKGYEVREDIVYRKDGKRLQLVVPENMIGSLLFQMHDGMGHMGEEKTCGNIRRNFYFEGMRELVKEHVARCLPCLKFNEKSGRKEQRLHVYERVPIPFDTVHIDHLGPLESTKKGYQHILVIVDAFTKYVRLYPAKSTSSREAVKAMEEYSRAYGYPRRVVSDRGTAFTSSKFKKWGNENGIKHVEVATACPRANGQVERFNRTMVPVLAKLANKEGREWTQLLKQAEFIMNNMESSTTGNTAARLLFGVDQRFGQKFEVEDWMDEMNRSEEVIEEIREIAKENLEKKQEYNKEYYDRKVGKEWKFKEGELVLLKGRKKEGGKSKLYGKFKGPYVVRKVLEKDRYLVTDVEGAQVGRTPYEGIVSTERMKLYMRNEEDRVEIGFSGGDIGAMSRSDWPSCKVGIMGCTGLEGRVDRVVELHERTGR